MKSFIALHNEGNGIRGISRILGISCNTVMRWKRIFAAKVTKPICYSFGHTYEIDEMYSYVGSKQSQVWIMYIFDSTTKRVIDYKVGSRSKDNMKGLIDQVLVKYPKQIGTDSLNFYKTLIPSDIHKVGLKYTRHIERFNLNLRTHLKYLTNDHLA